MKTLLLALSLSFLAGCATSNPTNYRCQTLGIGTKHSTSYCTENGRVTYIQQRNYNVKPYRTKK
jgi:hypothetical protein